MIRKPPEWFFHLVDWVVMVMLIIICVITVASVIVGAVWLAQHLEFKP